MGVHVIFGGAPAKGGGGTKKCDENKAKRSVWGIPVKVGGLRQLHQRLPGSGATAGSADGAAGTRLPPRNGGEEVGAHWGLRCGGGGPTLEGAVVDGLHHCRRDGPLGVHGLRG